MSHVCFDTPYSSAMITFPNAKINLGLNIIRKRNDGYHDLETIFYPIQLTDILEVNVAEQFSFTQTGITINDEAENNLIVKAYRLLQKDYTLTPVNVHLHKVIPMGAGLGGGSSDAAFMLKLLNNLFKLKLTEGKLLKYAIQLGSDCPFFIMNQPVYAEGRGEIFTDLEFSLKGLHLVLVKPPVHIPTATSYSKVIPHPAEFNLKEMVKINPTMWTGKVNNDFEKSVFLLYPEIKTIKLKLKQMGAIYTSMSGSGSSVFGIFKENPDKFPDDFKEYFVWQEALL